MQRHIIFSDLMASLKVFFLASC